jgi:regulator of PEP synthase PpsR (kinase-PPPase family)
VNGILQLPEPTPIKAPPIYVLSGGTGATGELLARTVLAQFRNVQADIVIVPNITSREEVEMTVQHAVETGGCILHTLVSDDLHDTAVRLTEEHGIFAVDLAGALLGYFGEQLGQQPIGVPGLYRKSQHAYFRRVEAIEFTVAHDDGKRVDDLPYADIVLVGVSRVGKTPLSMYLSMLGWKVANVPIVPGVPPPKQLQQVEKRRIVALQIDPAQLMAHRRWRQQHLGVRETGYVDRANIIEELREYNHFVSREAYQTLDVTDKPVESSAEEVIALISHRLNIPTAVSAPSP